MANTKEKVGMPAWWPAIVLLCVFRAGELGAGAGVVDLDTAQTSAAAAAGALVVLTGLLAFANRGKR